MNAVQLIGRLTHDPEADRTPEGKTVATFRIAVDRVGRDEADFVTVKVWDRLADAVVQHLARGRRVAVQGRLHHDEWTGSDGSRKSYLLVVARRVEFLDSGHSGVRPDGLEPAESVAAAARGRDGDPGGGSLSTAVERVYPDRAGRSMVPDEM